jgi:hypothetical protein
MMSYIKTQLDFTLIILLPQAPEARPYGYAAVIRRTRGPVDDDKERVHVTEPLQHDAILQGGRP